MKFLDWAIVNENLSAINQLIKHFIEKGKLNTDEIQHLIDNNFINNKDLETLRQLYPKQMEKVFNPMSELKNNSQTTNILLFYIESAILNEENFRQNDIFQAIMSLKDSDKNWLLSLINYNEKNSTPDKLRYVINKILTPLYLSLEDESLIKDFDTYDIIVKLALGFFKIIPNLKNISEFMGFEDENPGLAHKSPKEIKNLVMMFARRNSS